MANSKTVVVVAGPTAVGKTAVALRLAQHYGTEIISADSRQCFRELKIGVARPSDKELAAVPHHFIASHSILEKVTAATFEAYALEKAAVLFRHRPVVVVVGGTGLYIRTLLEGLDPVPEVPPAIHQAVNEAYRAKGLSWLQAEVAAADPQFYATGEILNPHRLLRALEVYRATGQSVLHFRKGIKAERDFKVVKIALDLPKAQLHLGINRRVEGMMAEGLLEEVRSLIAWRHCNALQTVGYKELFDYLDGRCTLEAAVAAIQAHTRQYAKRQLTWFRKDPGFLWFPPGDAEGMRAAIDRQLPPSART